MNMLPVKNYPKYLIDKSGNIYNSGGRIMKQEPVKLGANKDYLAIFLTNENGIRRKFLHILLGQTFLGMKTDQVLHKNGDRKNNSLDNLL